MNKKAEILLLEDDVFHRSLLAEGLEDYYDFEVKKVDSLESARQAIEKMTPDLLLLDLVLGDDRFEVIRWAKSLREGSRLRTTPILFVTAYYKEMEEHVRGLANTAILGKPFNFADVTQKIRGLLTLKNEKKPITS